MDEVTAVNIQAWAAIVAAASTIAAVGVAGVAARIAHDARNAEKAQARVAELALAAARRQTYLGAVPFLAPTAPPNLNVLGLVLTVVNGGPTVAYGILISLAGANVRLVDQIDAATERWSGRQAALAPDKQMSIGVKVDHLREPAGDREYHWTHKWIRVRLTYYSPLGATVTQDYMWDTRPDKSIWRLHRVTIDPKDGSAPLSFSLTLGPAEEGQDREA